MKLLDRYQDTLKNIKNPQLVGLMMGVQSYDWSDPNVLALDPNNSIVVGKNVAMADVVSTLERLKCDHFVQESNEDFYYDILASVLLLKQPEEILKNPRPLLIASLRSNPNSSEESRTMSVKFSHSSDKSVILKDLSRFLEDHSSTHQIINQVGTLADELLTYSLLTAPQSQPEKGAARGTFYVFHDKHRLIVGCQDNFGTYQRESFLKHLGQASQMKDGKFVSSDDQRVVSLKLILENSTGLYLIVRKGKQSVINCAVPLGVSQSKLSSYSKNIHLRFL